MQAKANSPIFAPLKTETFKVDSVAQLVEHNTFNVGVLGSNPSGITKPLQKSGFCYFKSLIEDRYLAVSLYLFRKSFIIHSIFQLAFLFRHFRLLQNEQEVSHTFLTHCSLVNLFLIE